MTDFKIAIKNRKENSSITNKVNYVLDILKDLRNQILEESHNCVIVSFSFNNINYCYDVFIGNDNCNILILKIDTSSMYGFGMFTYMKDKFIFKSKQELEQLILDIMSNCHIAKLFCDIMDK